MLNETKKSSYYAVISSTIYQEPSFIDYRFIADKAAKEMGFTVNLNSEMPGETQTAFNECMKNNLPVFILILGDVLTENVKNECETALNLGLHIMPFLKSTNNGTISEATKKNMISISKSMFEKDCCMFDSCERLYESVLNRLKAFISDGLHKTINYLKSKEDIYPQTAQMICSAKRRVILCQNTSSLLLGYRDDPIEKNCYNAMIEWMNSDNKLTFIHIFSESKTKEALKSSEYIALEEAKENLYYILSKKNGVHIYLRKSQSLAPCVVADNKFLISLSMGSNTHYLNLQSGFMKSEDVNTVTNLLEKEGAAWISNTTKNFADKIDEFYGGI